MSIQASGRIELPICSSTNQFDLTDMGTAIKTDWSVGDMEMLSRTLKAIAHPTRLSILEMLESEKRLTVTEIYTRLKADQSSISHHLSILRRRGVVGQERHGKFIFYFLAEGSYLSLLDCLSDIQRSASAYN